MPEAQLNPRRFRDELAELIASWIASQGMTPRQAETVLDLEADEIRRLIKGGPKIRLSLEKLITAFEKAGGRVHLSVDWPTGKGQTG